MTSALPYELVRLRNGVASVRSLAHNETFHPVIGPVAEAEALYVKQLKLRERVAAHDGEFVIWDVGLGAAANVLTVLQAVRGIPGRVRVLSFDHTLEPLRFALTHAEALGYVVGWEPFIEPLLQQGRVELAFGEQRIHWTLHTGDFPAFLEQLPAQCREAFPAPHAVLYDAYSPGKNPAMWTAPQFYNLFRAMDAARPCSLATFSRSTMLRVSLLLAGFFVGVGHATGEKEETTIAANTPALIEEPLGKAWLQRARQSTSAEPLWEPVYRQARLSEASWNKLQAHPQFSGPI